MADGSAPTWKRSSKCVTNNHCVEVWRRASLCQEATNCVEVAASEAVSVRDSKDPSPVIVFDREAWQQFVRWIG